MADTVDDILEEIKAECRTWLEEKRIGSLQINFFKGGVPNYTVQESRKFRGSATRKERANEGTNRV